MAMTMSMWRSLYSHTDRNSDRQSVGAECDTNADAIREDATHREGATNWYGNGNRNTGWIRIRQVATCGRMHAIWYRNRNTTRYWNRHRHAATTRRECILSAIHNRHCTSVTVWCEHGSMWRKRADHVRRHHDTADDSTTRNWNGRRDATLIVAVVRLALVRFRMSGVRMFASLSRSLRRALGLTLRWSSIRTPRRRIHWLVYRRTILSRDNARYGDMDEW